MGPATENSPIFLDCAESTSLNVTINATETTVVPGDVFHFYRQGKLRSECLYVNWLSEPKGLGA